MKIYYDIIQTWEYDASQVNIGDYIEYCETYNLKVEDQQNFMDYLDNISSDFVEGEEVDRWGDDDFNEVFKKVVDDYRQSKTKISEDNSEAE